MVRRPGRWATYLHTRLATVLSVESLLNRDVSDAANLSSEYSTYYMAQALIDLSVLASKQWRWASRGIDLILDLVLVLGLLLLEIVVGNHQCVLSLYLSPPRYPAWTGTTVHPQK